MRVGVQLDVLVSRVRELDRDARAGLQVNLRAELGQLVRDRGDHRDPSLVRPGFFEHRNLDWHERSGKQRAQLWMPCPDWATRACLVGAEIHDMSR